VRQRRGASGPVADEDAAREQGIEQRHPGLAGQMVVAGTGLRKRGSLPRLAQAAHRGGLAEVGQGLDRRGDPVPGQAVVPVTAPSPGRPRGAW
jgi:hypothetical protein